MIVAETGDVASSINRWGYFIATNIDNNNP